MILVCGKNKVSSDCFPLPHSMNGVFYLPIYTYIIYDNLNLSLWMCCIEGNVTLFGTWCKVGDATVLGGFYEKSNVRLKPNTTGDWAGNSSVHGGIHGYSIHRMPELSMVTNHLYY